MNKELINQYSNTLDRLESSPEDQSTIFMVQFLEQSVSQQDKMKTIFETLKSMSYDERHSYLEDLFHKEKKEEPPKEVEKIDQNQLKVEKIEAPKKETVQKNHQLATDFGFINNALYFSFVVLTLMGIAIILGLIFVF